MPIPTKVAILVIGGGPAGSYAASCLAREGHDVLLLEASKFPRYHIGESTLPSMRPFLRFIDLEKEFVEHGFYKKVGAAFKLSGDKLEAYTDFLAGGPDNYAWNVVRSQADLMLLRQAGTCGVKVFEETEVTEIRFALEGTQPVSALWKNSQGDSGVVHFSYLVDATGRRGIMSTKYLGNRLFTQSLKNIAIWSYWTDTGTYKPDSPRAGSPYFEALRDESGWTWFIPLHDGSVSIGVVINQEVYKHKRAAHSCDLASFYLQELNLAPDTIGLIGKGSLVESSDGVKVRSASDYSYSAVSYAGHHFRIIGDAGAFIDPLFSSGVHLAISSALSAAITICASIRGDCSEADAARWHTTRIGTSYTLFLVVVLSAYQQMKAQKSPILSDIDAINFDRAFEKFRPIIQGSLDSTYPMTTEYTGREVTEDELQKTMDFCSQIYMQRVEDIRLAGVLNMTESIETIATSPFYGLCPRLERGRLGLQNVDNQGKERQ